MSEFIAYELFDPKNRTENEPAVLIEKNFLPFIIYNHIDYYTDEEATFEWTESDKERFYDLAIKKGWSKVKWYGKSVLLVKKFKKEGDKKKQNKYKKDEMNWIIEDFATTVSPYPF